MRANIFTLALVALIVGLLGSCKKDNGPENPQQTLPKGALPGEFSVSATEKVHFSQGNLYYDGNAYRFETNQYDVQSSWTTSHVNLFFWSKTASVAYAKTYDESDTSASDVFFTNATETTAKTDFTVNGVTGKYRTLSTIEWQYLFYTNSRMVNSKPCYSNAAGGVIIEGTIHKGIFLYPDNYNGDIVSSSMTWNQINEAGIVFLPATGCRDGADMYFVGTNGLYWSSSGRDGKFAYIVGFNSGGALPDSYDHRSNGYSVRLITESN